LLVVKSEEVQSVAGWGNLIPAEGANFSITNTFYNVVEKRNPYQSKILCRRHEPTPASF